MNNLLGITCTAAITNDTYPPSGRSFSAPDKLGRKVLRRHHFCQDLSSHGGIQHRGVLPNTWLFTKDDFKYCVTLHALKLCEDFRYAFYKTGYLDQGKVPPCGPCLLGVAIYVGHAQPSLVDPNLDWLNFAAALGVSVFRATNKNITALPSRCKFYAFVSGGVYLRLLPLIHTLQTAESLPTFVARWEDLQEGDALRSFGGKVTWLEDGVEDCVDSSVALRATSQSRLADLFERDLNGDICR